MNWTEGTLNRHSRGRKGKEMILRQKHYFAKARSGLLNTNVQRSLPSISFLSHPNLSSTPTRRASLKSAAASPRKRSDNLESSRYFSEIKAEMPNPATFQRQQTGEEALRQKQQKLLLKGDWVGTDIQKPIDIRFSKKKASTSNAWGARLSRHEFSRDRLRQLLGVKHDDGQRKVYQSGIKSSTLKSPGKIRIRVGSHEKTLGSSSSISRGHRGGASSSHEGHEARFQGTQDKSSMPGSDTRTHQSSQDSGHRQLISPMLFHPVPNRPALSQLLSSHSIGSDNAESTVAQVGIQRPLISLAQIEENEAWKAFVTGPSGINASINSSTFGEEQFTFETLVSPGVSQLGQTRPIRDTDHMEKSTHEPVLETDEVNEEMTNKPPFNNLVGLQMSLVGSESSSSDGQIDLAPEDLSFELMDRTLAQASETPNASGLETRRYRHMKSESSDEVSLLVIPSSPSSSILSQTFQPEDTTSESTTQVERPGGHQDLPRAQGKPHPVEKPKKDISEDENELWMKFVHGGSDVNSERVREDARKETARNLRPSIASSSPCDENSRLDTRSWDDFHKSSESFALGPEFEFDRQNSAQDPQQSSTTASASQVTTTGLSSPVLASEFQYSQTTMRTDQATSGSSIASLLTQADLMDGLTIPTVTKDSTTGTDKVPLTFQPHQVEKHGESDEGFRFARPKLFVGKKLAPVDEGWQIALSTAQIRGRTQARRRSTRTSDGRANIRKLPNYGSDPIEEFEEDARSNRAQQGSLFGSLEMEESS